MRHLLYYIVLLAAVLLTACTSDVVNDREQPLPEGMGRIRITITTPENVATTRAVRQPNAWEDPDHEWERLQTFRVLICDADNKVVQIISGDKTKFTAEAHTGSSSTDTDSESSTHKAATITSDPLPAGDYHVFATANYADGYNVGSTIDPENTTIQLINGLDKGNVVPGSAAESNIPMTGKLMNTDGSLKSVSVSNGVETDAGTLAVWRVVGKLSFEFVNETSEQLQILGIEVEPINQASTTGPGIFLFSKDNLESETNLSPGTSTEGGKEIITLPNGARDDVGPVRYEPATALDLAAKNEGNTDEGNTDEGNLFFYVNESDGTFTTTENQYSLRFKIQRKNGDEWFDEELRYGMTTAYTDGTTGGNGFNVIRRNDWIHIPIHLTDWQFRVEPLAFVPIAGYPAKTISSDGLTATFSTGGPIIMQVFAQKNNDGTWRDFTDPEVTFKSITWKNIDGTDVSDDGKIFVKAPTYDATSGCIVGVLNNNLTAGGTYKTSITVTAELGSGTAKYVHAFTFNVVLKKS